VERISPSGAHVRVGLLDEADNPVPLQDLAFVKAAGIQREQVASNSEWSL
jgi:hypothetical protein